MAIVGPDVQDAALERALSQLIAENLRPGGALGVDTLNDLIPLLSGFDIRLPPELTTVFRTLVLLDGTARTISPGYSLPDSLRRVLDAGGPAGPMTGSVPTRSLNKSSRICPGCGAYRRRSTASPRSAPEATCKPGCPCSPPSTTAEWSRPW